MYCILLKSLTVCLWSSESATLNTIRRYDDVFYFRSFQSLSFIAGSSKLTEYDNEIQMNYKSTIF